VQKAGISTTGAKIENELIPLKEEFIKYRKEQKLWSANRLKVSYEIKDDEIVRTLDDKEIVL
jgi:type I restriction enzyme M protein